MNDGKEKNAGELFEELVGVMARLRGRDGCPWDREQTHTSLKRYALEETYELLEAIDQGDDGAIRDELGDVLLQVLFHAQMASEDRRFAIEEVMAGLRDKLVRRHPHVFGDERATDADAVLRNWEKVKALEKPAGGAQGHTLFTSVPRAMPALARAQRIGDKASSIGFDWPDVEPVWRKVEEELQELKEAVGTGEPHRVEAEARGPAVLGGQPEPVSEGPVRGGADGYHRAVPEALRPHRAGTCGPGQDRGRGIVRGDG